jgi:large subunit ribosomal protein L3
MSLTLIGKKRGMTRLFDKKTGKITPCTVIEVAPNVVTQIKTPETDGYTALQLASIPLSSADKGRAKKPILGDFAAKNLEPRKVRRESRLDNVSEYTVGQELEVSLFKEGDLVDVRGNRKGRGYQGVIKRYRKSRIVKSHGAGVVVRHIGSVGSLRAHGRVQKNKKMAGHMGPELFCVECLRVLGVDPEKKALIVKGSVPGANGGLVYIRGSIKG